jgi:opacity protein-like surface antigen
MHRHKNFAIALFAALLCCWSHAAQAQTSDYNIQITPYLFWTGINGTIGEQGRTANVDASFGDIVHHLDMVAMVYFDARIGRWRVLVDNLYTKVSDARATPGPLFSSVHVATKTWIVDPEAGYAIVRKEGKEVDVTAGARIWNINNDVSLVRPDLSVNRGSGTQTIADPIIGGRFCSDIGQKLFLTAKADIGGFNASASTDWQAFGAAGFKINNTIVASVGYRYLSVDYSANNATFDVHLNGVIVGLGFRF